MGKDNAKNRSRLIELFNSQKGACYWCHLPMLPVGGSISKLSATLDHLSPNRQRRHSVAAHRYCNNSRHHDDSISLKAKRTVEIAVRKMIRTGTMAEFTPQPPKPLTSLSGVPDYVRKQMEKIKLLQERSANGVRPKRVRA